MNLNKIILLISFLSFIFQPNNTTAQNDTINLKNCIDDAVKNNPLFNNLEYYEKLSALKLSNFNSGYYPQFKFNAQATYQSDVTKINVDLNIPNLNIDFPSPSKDQYKAALEVNQIIFDGGIIKNNKLIEEKDKLINLQQIKIELYKLKEQICNIYFSVLLNKKKTELFNIILEEINNRKIIVESNIKNGLQLPINLDILISEELKIKQQLFEINQNIKISIEKLNELTGKNYNENSLILIPDFDFNISINNDRPENLLFDLQIEKINSTKNLLNSQLLPKAYAFSQLGYGKPGLNMLSDKFDTYYIIGVGINWNFFDWNKTKREKQQLDIQKNIINSNKQNFNRNLDIALKNQIAQIEKLKKLIETDQELIKLRENISKVSAAQLDKGIITSTAYLTELNAEKQAKVEYETHKLQLVFETISLLIMQNLY